YQGGMFNLSYTNPDGNFTLCPPPPCLHNPDFPVYWMDLNLNNYYASKVSQDNCTWDGQPHLLPGNASDLVDLVAERMGCDSAFLNKVYGHMIEFVYQSHANKQKYLMCAANGGEENSICCANSWFAFPDY